MALQIEVVSRIAEKWVGEASQISVPSIEGEMGILPGRQPVLVILGNGDVRIDSLSDGAVTIPVLGGFCSLDHDTVTVAADFAGDEVAEELAHRQAKAAGVED